MFGLYSKPAFRGWLICFLRVLENRRNGAIFTLTISYLGKVKHIPNILSALRIIGAFCLLSCSPATVTFWVIYGLCGISDMLDGFLARKLHAESQTGAVLDSVADICFVASCATRLLPILQIPTWLWIWAGLIVIIKIINQISALVVCKRLSFPHTLANKLTGLLLFLSVPMTFWSVVPIAIVAGIATFAAVQEGHFIRTRKIFG